MCVGGSSCGYVVIVLYRCQVKPVLFLMPAAFDSCDGAFVLQPSFQYWLRRFESMLRSTHILYFEVELLNHFFSLSFLLNLVDE